ncbi:MAG: hypothetical protein R2851_23340 [Caldilineaceae bacterium]
MLLGRAGLARHSGGGQSGRSSAAAPSLADVRAALEIVGVMQGGVWMTPADLLPPGAAESSCPDAISLRKAKGYGMVARRGCDMLTASGERGYGGIVRDDLAAGAADLTAVTLTVALQAHYPDATVKAVTVDPLQRARRAATRNSGVHLSYARTAPDCRRR